MVEIKQGNIWGRIGSGFGKGVSQALSEQVPKYIESKQLSEGLQKFADENPDSPMIQQYAKLLSTPHISPQAVQTFGELAKQQNMRKAYTGTNKKLKEEGIVKKDPELVKAIQDIQFANQQPENKYRKGQEVNSPNVQPNEMGQPQIVPKNPLREEAQPKSPWTPERYNREVGDILDVFPAMTVPEAQAMAKENEARELAQPEAEQRKDENFKRIQIEANDKFTKSLETKLQKQGTGVFGDITGESLNNLKRGMERDLRTNPNASVDDVVNDWTNRALDFAKAKDKLISKARSNLFATPILLRKDAFRRELEDFGDIYRKSGNSEEFYNTLKTEYSMSPSGAATMAYPINKNINKYIEKNNKVPKGLVNLEKNSADARKAAIEIESLMTSNDSILSVERAFKTANPYFDSESFYDQISKDKDEASLNPRQRRELTEGGQILPSWGDILILPLFRSL